jgi:hypothetical protein
VWFLSKSGSLAVLLKHERVKFEILGTNPVLLHLDANYLKLSYEGGEYSQIFTKEFPAPESMKGIVSKELYMFWNPFFSA